MDFEINSFGAGPPPVSNADQITYQAPMVQSLAPNQVEYSQPPPPSFTSPGDPVVVVPHGAAPGSVVRMGMGHPYGQPVRHLNRPSYYPMPTYRPVNIHFFIYISLRRNKKQQQSLFCLNTKYALYGNIDLHALERVACLSRIVRCFNYRFLFLSFFLCFYTTTLGDATLSTATATPASLRDRIYTYFN